MDELCRTSASQLAHRIRTKSVSSREVLDATLKRISEVNPKINAITVTLEESAMEAANLADNATGDERQRPLHGVPFTVKENIDVLGTPTTNGIPAFSEAFPLRNDPIVERMLQAGAILVGRTNLPELGMRLDTDNPLRGRTTNPWNPKLTPGGSSGGDAAALATGMTPFGLGNDIGGSLRNPAYCCGIASLKPSAGVIPWAPSIEPVDLGIPRVLLSNGPMARSVEDLRAGYAVLAGRHRTDPESLDPPSLGIFPDKPTAALVVDVGGSEIPDATTRAIESAGEILREKGWKVEVTEAPELERVYEVWATILNPLTANLPRELFKKETADYLDRLSRTQEDGALAEALIERQRLRRLWSFFFSKYSVCIGPIWGNLPWPIDTDLDPEIGVKTLRQCFSFIVPGNCLGIPSIALPTGEVSGLPTGIQIYSELYREDLCFAAAELIERETVCPTPIEPRF